MFKTPKLRFKDKNGNAYPKWENIKIGEKLKICRGASPRPINAFITTSKDGINWIKIGDVSPNTNIINNVKEKITAEGAKKSRFVKKGDLILSNSMSFGRPYILNVDGCIHDGWLLIKDPYETFNKQYLCYLLDTTNVKNQYKRLAAGGVVINLNSELVRSVKVAVPNIEEQEKIAGFLSKVDELINECEGEVKDLEEQKKGLMQKIFSQQIRFKDSNNNPYPDWEEKYVNEVCDISTGKGNTQDKEDNGIYPFYVRSAIIERSNKYIFDGEAVLTVGDGVGTGKVYHYVNGKFNFHQRVYKMSNFNGILGKYFYYYFSTHFYDRVKKMTAKTSVDSVRLEMISKMTLLIPCQEEQEKIAKVLSKMDELIEEKKALLIDLQQFKKGLLQQMFV